MNFLNVGPWELTVVVMIAILMIGPQRMVDLARTIRRYATQLRKLSGEFTSVLQTEIQATEQGARKVLGEMRQVVEETQAAAIDALGESNLSEQGEDSQAEAPQVSDGDDKGPTGASSAVKEGDPRPLVDVFKDGLGISSMQAQMQAIGQETRDVLGSALSGGLALSDLQEEIRAVGKETRQAVSDVEQTVKTSVSSVVIAPIDLGSTQSEALQGDEVSTDADSDKVKSPAESEEQQIPTLDADDPLAPLTNSESGQADPADSPGC